MNIFKITAFALFLAFSLGAINITANAGEPAKMSTATPNAIITHLLEAKSEIMHRDFIPPSAHIKAARAASKEIIGDPETIKQGRDCIIQAQIKINQGDKQGAMGELDKALKLYESSCKKSQTCPQRGG